jgi:hypothetical protein
MDTVVETQPRATRREWIGRRRQAADRAANPFVRAGNPIEHPLMEVEAK